MLLLITVNGICYGLGKGSYSISLNSETHSSYMRSGFATWASRLFVDEIGQGTWSGGECELINY